jgi:predicted AlkP superfamily pyrophosphatase or phosphodiesterase
MHLSGGSTLWFRRVLLRTGLLQLATITPAVAQAVPAPRPPKLVVFITVDQLTPDYFDRYALQFTGGLGRLLKGGAVFTNAFQDHANTETAPGHASTMSGRFPRSTGIVLNAVGVPDPEAPLIGGGGPGASPFRFRGGTLIDWLRMKDPHARALSVSRKDRGAILPLGRAHQSVYWYASDGRFTTSRYYADTLPTWVQRFNARRVPQASAGKTWTLLHPETEYPELDSVSIESGGQEITFPHHQSTDTAQAARDFIAFPWMDELTADMALAGMNELSLGAGTSTDILAVSFSSTDAVGHRFGFESREIHDQILRLDRTLGVFIDSLYKLRDSSTIAIALTSDHGITPTPELVWARTHVPAYRVDLSDLGAAHRSALIARGLDSSAFIYEDAMLFVDPAAFARAHLDPNAAIDAFRTDALKTLGVLRVDTRASLARADTLHDAVARRWMHALSADLPVALVVTLAPNSVWGSYAAGIHGGPSDHDAHVPVIFYGPMFKTGQYAEFARVVDMAPTLSRVMNVVPTDVLDGHVLQSALIPTGRGTAQAMPAAHNDWTVRR